MKLEGIKNKFQKSPLPLHPFQNSTFILYESGLSVFNNVKAIIII